MDAAARGAAAISSRDFSAAVTHYTNAISSNPQAVDYYIKRSIAYTRLSPADYASALKDSELAVVLAKKRGKKELIIQSQLRRGIALFGLERWADAQQCFEWVSKLDKDEKSLKIWGIKVQGKLDGLEPGDEKGLVSVKEVPEVDVPKDVEVKKVDQLPATVPATVPATTSEGVQTPANKIRHEWYQTTNTIVVTLFAKGIPKDKATIDLKENSLAISFPLPSGSEFQFSLDYLYANIDASLSTSKIMSTKAEFTLIKSTPGQKWPTLEGTERSITENRTEPTTDPSPDAIKRAVLSEKAPSYPTSSKTGTKNWDKLADDLTKKPKKEKKEEEEDQGDADGADYDFEGGDQVNGFFQMLYKDADPDTRRAMMKSYVESNGTSLSTNWEQVGKQRIEPDPPDGMEVKKW